MQVSAVMLLARAIGADQRAGFEQRQLVGGADVQHVQAGAVPARERQRQLAST